MSTADHGWSDLPSVLFKRRDKTGLWDNFERFMHAYIVFERGNFPIMNSRFIAWTVTYEVSDGALFVSRFPSRG
jgi:hypothetical protein